MVVPYRSIIAFIFINVAKDIGNDYNLSAEEHPSIKIIKENKKEIPKLIFLNLLYLFALIQNHFQFHEILI
jgi:hypothetical protein